MRGGVTVTAATHLGLKREVNEDRIVVGPWVLGPLSDEVASITLPPSDGLVAAVIDGMGGHSGGDVAASLVAEVVASRGGKAQAEESALELAVTANLAVYQRMASLAHLAGMGATLAGLLISQGSAWILNVGDSRVFVERDGYLVQLSTDDSAPNGTLTQSLGGVAQFQPVVPHLARDSAAGNRFLLATDGLFGCVDDTKLEQCMSQDDRSSVKALLAAALEAGGPDNISIILVSIPETVDAKTAK